MFLQADAARSYSSDSAHWEKISDSSRFHSRWYSARGNLDSDDRLGGLTEITADLIQSISDDLRHGKCLPLVEIR